MNKKNENNFRSGFVGIIGAPNAGKSTLLNQLLGQKISITSKKPQTTRDRILGIVNRPASQIIFVDTPGIHKSTTLLNKRIVAQAMLALEDVDVILFMIDSSSRNYSAEKLIISQLKKTNKTIILALNKIDLVKKALIYNLVEEFQQLHDFKAIVPISAKNNIQVKNILEEVEGALAKGPSLFSEETFTDVSEKFMVKEIIREKVFRLTGMEIPYSSAVTVDSFEVEKKLIVIHASIHVVRDSQKGIIIGKKGSMLSQIGTKARKDIEQMTGQKVLLKLFVKVTKNWVDNKRILDEFGY
ncbi:MAG: GTPase Era [Desulfobacula sp.]|jgi:GTP-binding protein Era|uniref:GTPase Era n=1 Tax=Desulfobacula sp. TaxID=2593537 RepID=UPI001D51A594|nr:GTPase Era [Desulfobacula sp.]MBT3485018.1 GTPase Era [Desulfobacula sp.]MBT3804165.1 GTPase Era [Desulfobacula sp.]MBT4025021.1 GTPase Era [Desulfobacula sp.]MBT4198669.1 GTPase Era [Desulfobacula sp.]